MHGDALRAERPGSAEAVVLNAFIHRRAERADERWLESLLSSWEFCGRPKNFTFLAGVSLDDELNALADSADPVAAIGAAIIDHAGIALRLWTVNSPAVLLDGARAQLARPADTLGRLFTMAQLSWAERDPGLRGHAAGLRVPLLRELADANPTTFELSTLPILDEVKRGERLQHDHAGRLLAALEMDTRPDLAAHLYAELLRQRAAQSAIEHRLAWLDTMSILPDASFTVWRYLKAAEKAADLIRLARELGAREAASRMVMRRIVGLELQRLAASWADDSGELGAVNAALGQTRRLLRHERGFDPDWPIAPLSIEVTDAIVRDEIELLTRCAFPE